MKPVEAPRAPVVVTNGASLFTLLDQWAAERRKPERTAYNWRLILNKFVDHVGHDDVERITKAQVVSWRDASLAEGKSVKTTKDYLTVLRTIIQAALDSERLTRVDNPARGVKVLAEAEQTESVRPYTLEEAKMVLAAAAQQTAPELRVLPVLLFATGARIAEVAGLLVRDVITDDHGRMAIAIQANAHRRLNKTSARTIPLPDWAAEAIVEYALERRRQGQGDDLLFPDITPANGNIAGNVGQRWSGVVRRAGVTDPTISPAHSARHLYIDLCRQAGLDTALIDCLTGHSTPGLQARYGRGWDLETLRRAISKINWPQ